MINAAIMICHGTCRGDNVNAAAAVPANIATATMANSVRN